MPEEEIIILEANEESESSQLKDDAKEKLPKPAQKKKKLIFAGAGIFVLLLILTITVSILKNSKDLQVADINTTQIVEKLNNKGEAEQFSPSRLENMIKKANILYERGNKNDALKIYEKIATFNEGISFYNIGVAKLKEKNYQGALDSFKKAIDNGEQRGVSSINAAVSALNLGEKDLFKYYIDLAYTYLPQESNSPLYSYYIGLVNYYRNYSYEALAALSNKSSIYYNYEQNYLASKILSSINLNSLSLNLLEKDAMADDSLTLGLLYAKIGDFKIAQKHLLKALNNTNDPLHVKSALLLVDNKLGLLETSATLMKELISSAKNEESKNIYPIKVSLKESIFNINIAQKEFENELFFNNERAYSLLFYFSPYKVFNAKQTVNYIRKGSINVFLDEIGPALSYLKTSSTISKVNISISKGIKAALNYHTKQANEIFKKTINIYPKHSILHYNLALTYAQMSNYNLAYKNFSKSYHLDNGNYLAGAFAILTGQLVGANTKKLAEDIKSSISSDKNLPETNLFMALIHLSENNQLSMTRWIEEKKERTPLNLMFDIIIAKKTFNKKEYRQKTAILKAMLPNDLIANIINFNMQNKDKNIKIYAKEIQMKFKNNELNFESFLYGPRIVKETYIKLLQISGLLYWERNRLLKAVELEEKDMPAITQTLAFLSIYTHNFEEAYVLYNKLIDDFKQNDTRTVFLAAVASVGAGHIENAVALLELSKIIDPKNNESRYGLGLLYQEIKNYKGAIIQYMKIGDSNFKSKYFSFKINR